MPKRRLGNGFVKHLGTPAEVRSPSRGETVRAFQAWVLRPSAALMSVNSSNTDLARPNSKPCISRAKPRQPRPADLSFAPGDTGTEMIVDQAGRGHGHSRRIDSCQRQAYMLSVSDILKPAGLYFRLRECCHRCDKGRREQRAGKISRKRCGGRCRICAREQRPHPDIRYWP
jgi:hypothetical protein